MYAMHLGSLAGQVKEDLDRVIPEAEELKKLTKAKLVELAGELDVPVDSKLTKAKILAEFESNR